MPTRVVSQRRGLWKWIITTKICDSLTSTVDVESIRAAFSFMQTEMEFLPIHPFADEPELLAKLNLKAEDCRSVDAYWRIGDDVCFLQVWLSTDDPLGRSGLFLHLALRS